MIPRLTRLLLTGLLVVLFWHTDTYAQEDEWDRHYRAGEAAYRQRDFDAAIC